MRYNKINRLQEGRDEWMVTVEVCVGSSCYVKGSNQVVAMVKEMIEMNHWEDQVELKGAFCMQMCSEGLGIKVNGKPLFKVGLHNVREELTRAIEEALS